MSEAKKLAVFLAIFLLVTTASIKKTLQLLKRVLCTYYPLYFKKDLHETRL